MLKKLKIWYMTRLTYKHRLSGYFIKLILVMPITGLQGARGGSITPQWQNWSSC